MKNRNFFYLYLYTILCFILLANHNSAIGAGPKKGRSPPDAQRQSNIQSGSKQAQKAPQRQETRAKNIVSKTPSMSRIETRPNNSTPRNPPGSQNKITTKSIPQIPQDRLKQVMQNKNNAYHQPNLQKYTNQKELRLKQNNNYAPAVNNVRNRINKDFPENHNWFNNNFYERHNYQPYYQSQNNGWGGLGWIAINNWVSGGWDYPIYYSENGSLENIPTEADGTTFETETATPQNIQNNSLESVQGDWLPIGVFVASKDIAQASYSNMFVELAMNKAGEIAGTYYNSAADQTHALGGILDKKTQEAAWLLSDNPRSALMTTSIYDLTQDIVPIQVHFPDGTLQAWILVRLTQ